MIKTVVITGITGQMGSYFAEFLLEKNFRVVGVVRRLSVPNRNNIYQIKNPNFILELGDLGDSHSIERIINKYKPEYFINCAANSFVGTSWDCPEQHFEYNTLGVLRQLEVIRKHSPTTRYLNFGSSEEFGDVAFIPQNEIHPPRARSPYGASKCAARQIVKVWRESYNLYALQCWCFNYESPRRGEEFISRKITKGITRIINSINNKESFKPIELGNLYSKRDWSHALDFVDGVWRMLNQEEFNSLLKSDFQDSVFHYIHDSQNPKSILWETQWLSKYIKEYVFSSGQTHTVKDFINKCLELVNIKGEWVGEGLNEKFIINNYLNNIFNLKSSTIIEINKEFYRPAEVNLLLGSSELAKKELGWAPKISFNSLIKNMLENDLKEYNINYTLFNEKSQ